MLGWKNERRGKAWRGKINQLWILTVLDIETQTNTNTTEGNVYTCTIFPL